MQNGCRETIEGDELRCDRHGGAYWHCGGMPKGKTVLMRQQREQREQRELRVLPIHLLRNREWPH